MKKELQDRTDLSIPFIPHSIVFSPTNPFSYHEMGQITSENIEEESFDHLATTLTSTMLNKKKNDYFNKKILEFNENRKNCSIPLSEETRQSSYSIPYSEKHMKAKLSFFSERTEIGTSINSKLLINDTLDFLKKMQNYDLLEEEFLIAERMEFEKNEQYLDYLEGIVKEEAESPAPLINSKQMMTNLKSLKNKKTGTNYNFSQDPVVLTEKFDIYTFLIDKINQGNLQNVKLALKSLSVVELNRSNADGQTPLLLAIKLAKNNTNYPEIVRTLLMAGANPKIKDKSGWSPLDEAISQSNVKITLYLFDYLSMMKKEFFDREKCLMLELLEKLPDFYLEMKWDFESSIIPLLGKLAPSDTFKIWKYKKSLRMDYSLVGLKNLKSKKRDMTLLFNPLNEVAKRKDVKEYENGKGIEMFWIVNRSKNQFTNPLQEIDFYEKKTILYDLMTSQAFEGNMNIIKCDCNESVNWMGNRVTQKINNWKAKKFDFLLTYEYNFHKKEKNSVELPKMKLNQNKSETTNAEKKEINFLKKLENLNFPIPAKKEKKIKKNSASIWISEDFPLKFPDLLPLFNFLSNGNTMLNKLNTVLQNSKIQEILHTNGFPIKVQIPINFTIRANIGFLSFQFLNKNENLQNLFEIPDSMPYCDRKIAQKILTRTKKRMILTNALI